MNEDEVEENERGVIILWYEFYRALKNFKAPGINGIPGKF